VIKVTVHINRFPEDPASEYTRWYAIGGNTPAHLFIIFKRILSDFFRIRK